MNDQEAQLVRQIEEASKDIRNLAAQSRQAHQEWMTLERRVDSKAQEIGEMRQQLKDMDTGDE